MTFGNPFLATPIGVALSSKFCGSYCSSVGTFSSNSIMFKHKALILHVYVADTWLAALQFSLPMPRGGRDAITKNPILREDQLPHKLLHPKTKKKSNKPVSFHPFHLPHPACLYFVFRILSFYSHI